jgi:hypothetical protein
MASPMRALFAHASLRMGHLVAPHGRDSLATRALLVTRAVHDHRQRPREILKGRRLVRADGRAEHGIGRFNPVGRADAGADEFGMRLQTGEENASEVV